MPWTDDIDSLSGTPGVVQRVRIPASLKVEFEAQDSDQRRQQAVWGMVLGLCCYIGLLGVDWFVVPDVALLNAGLRIGVGLPIGILATWLLTRPGLPFVMYELLPAVFGLACAFTIAIAMSRSTEPAGLAYLCAGLVVMCFTINLVGMNPPVAALLCAAIAVIMSWYSGYSRFGSEAVRATYLVFGLMVGGVATFANWCLLNQRRHGFLLRKQDEARLEQIARQRDLLQRLATVDALTDLPNRRGFEAMVASDLSAQSAGTPLATMMIDIDCFKAFNDGYGHPSGDEALRTVGAALDSICGDGVRIGRIGGEEFGIVAYAHQSDDLLHMGERLRQTVEDCKLPHQWSDVAHVVTISVGIARGTTRDGQRDCSHLFLLADKALYEAKRAGRNRVVLVEDMPKGRCAEIAET